MRLRDLIILTVAAFVAAAAIATKSARADEAEKLEMAEFPFGREAEERARRLLERALEPPKEDWAVVSLRSYHFRREGQNERNWGFGFEKDLRWLLKDLRLSAGAYNNSSNDLSAYFNGLYLPLKRGPWRAGLTAGLAYGYGKEKEVVAGEEQSKKTNDLIPFFGGVLAYEGKEYGLNLILIPAGGGVIGSQGKARW